MGQVSASRKLGLFGIARFRLAARTALLLVALLHVGNGVDAAGSTNILDLIYWDIGAPGAEAPIEKRTDGAPSQSETVAPSDGAETYLPLSGPPKTCECSGPSCYCCVDFNITYIDLGGPGCVKMKYISQSEGVSVNVSYGESLLQSAQIRGGSHPTPTCIALLGSLAAVCARFSTLETYDDGLKGCLLLEPKLLGDIQTQFSIGCFSMDSSGMRVDDTMNTTTASADGVASHNTNSTSSENLSEEDILAAVSESAQQGLAFFGNLLGFSIEENKTDNSTELPTLQIKEKSEPEKQP